MKLKFTRCTLSQKHWYCCTRTPTSCPYCKEKGVRKSIFGYPSQEDFYSKNIIFKIVALTSLDLEIGVASIVMQPSLKRKNP
tara:strand:- start:826 stop:1071 length:246 start_codon:yes stop_codon:yes gene_type:complete